MKVIITTALLIFGLQAFANTSINSCDITSTKLELIDTRLKKYVEKKLFSGEVLIACANNVLLHKQYGFSSWKAQTKITPNSIFKIGSITKQFTATAILRLEEKGLLSVQDPVGKYIPEIPSSSLSYQGTSLTIHHLLSQTSGLPKISYANKLKKKEPSFDVVLQALSSKKLTREPGARYRYQSINYVLLGEIIRRITNQSYEHFLKNEFFIPLGMNNSGIKPAPAQKEKFALGNISTGFVIRPSKDIFGNFLKGDYDWDIAAGGAIFSTVHDLNIWLTALADGKVLSKISVSKMITPYQEKYGYGWVVKESHIQSNERLIWHNGAISPFGYKADISWTTNSKLKLIILGNLDYSSMAKDVHKSITMILENKKPSKLTANHQVNALNIFALVLWSKLYILAALFYLIYHLILSKKVSKLSAYFKILNSFALIFFVSAFNLDYFLIGLLAINLLLVFITLKNTINLPALVGQRKKDMKEAVSGIFSIIVMIGVGIYILYK